VISLSPLGPRIVNLGVAAAGFEDYISIKSSAAVTQVERGVVVPLASCRRLMIISDMCYSLKARRSCRWKSKVEGNDRRSCNEPPVHRSVATSLHSRRNC